VFVNSEGFRAEFQQRIEVLKNPVALMRAVGREASERLRAHFDDKNDKEPNKLGGKRTNFWLQIRRSVQNPVIVDIGTVSVTISDPRFAQKLFGGTITAKLARALTIPETPEAYGLTAGSFEAETGLKLFIIKIGGTKTNGLENAALAAKVNGHLTVEYLLTPSVTQQADPDALPDMTELEAAIISRADKFIECQMKNPGTAENVDPT
jgi:hypothetical protein